ncbi:DNA starvation/stationary phase protection protein [Luteimonas viscosa]|uniref:DNA starvation/stationary phase protection protein n=1 Tax=Luteimonas viscosa TaxID=1132694 RepID=A0A5D4XEM4_9GAMM|nr:Dps family protein [Luteimonas viscosa]TYT23079.1 DNA starvation/stationary phase protection protein [Luteimonas viscosa]
MSKTKPAKPAKTAKAAKQSKDAKPAVAISPAASPATGGTGPAIDIGISDKDRRQIAKELSKFLADSYTLYLKTHNFHWNVTGPMFNALHNMFEAQYTEQWTALDDIAERIRALGFNAPGSYAEFVKLSSITEEAGATEAPEWREMVRQLVVGNEAVCRTARKALDVADDADDAPTEDLLTQRLQTHEKYAWMLRSLLQ